MEIISPLLIYSAAVELQKMRNLIESGQQSCPVDGLVTPQDCAAVSSIMEHVRKELLKLNCPNAAKSAAKPAKWMEQGHFTYGKLLEIVKELDGRLIDEAEDTYAFSLTHYEAAFFNPMSPLLGPEVAQKFECVSFDIEEGGKCLALGRGTAAVFHAFRVLEAGVRAMAKCLDVTDPDKPKMRNWGFILDESKRAIELKWPSDTDRDSGDGKLFWDVYSIMLALKVPRNGTMHPARKYTEQEADKMFRLIGDIMMSLAGRMDESGEPRA